MEEENVEVVQIFYMDEPDFINVQQLLVDYNNHLLDFKETLKSDKKAMKKKGMSEFIEAIDEKRKYIASYISFMQNLRSGQE